MFKVGVVGAGGRMGQEVCRAVTAAPDMELVAAVDPATSGPMPAAAPIVGEVNALGDLGAEVVVDFTVAEAGRHNVPHYAAPGDPRRHRHHRALRTTSPRRRAFGGTGPNAIVAANFAVGAVLLMHFAHWPPRTWTASK